MRTLALILIFFAVPLAQGTFQPTREADFWQTTGVDLAFAQGFISNDICYKSEHLLNSCQEAFAVAGTMLDTFAFHGVAETGAAFKTRSINFDLLLKEVETVLADKAKSGHRHPREMVYGAMVNAQLEMFDPHARIVPKAQLKASFGNARRQLTGIGVEEEVNGRGLVIRKVYADTPAAQAGLRANDWIVSIEGEAVLPGIRAVKALRKLARKPSERVNMVIERGGRRFSVVVAIADLSLPDVERVENAEVAGGNFGLIDVRNFGENSCDAVQMEMDRYLSRLRQKGVEPGSLEKRTGVILDLRNNQGGSLGEAACVMSLFAGAQEFVRQQEVGRLLPREFSLVTQNKVWSQWDGRDQWREKMRRSALYPKIPLLVLVNAYTASAAEMLAASLQDLGRAWLVGESTFGKGLTQAVVSEPCNDNLRLVYTVTQYFRTNGAPIHLIGVNPDFDKPFERNATLDERTFAREADHLGRGRRVAGAAWLFSSGGEKTGLEAKNPAHVRQIRGLAACVANHHLDSEISAARRAVSGYEDNQSAYAMALLSCQ